MNRDDIEKLLGGYAAGTLTEGERQALFAAALEDQQLFESLAAEEPLRELLQDPAARAQLLAALGDRPVPWYRRLLFPAFGIAAAAAMVLLAVFVRYEPPKPEPVIVAQTRHEPVRSFQPPLPVEKSALPNVLKPVPALPPPPQLPTPTAPEPALDAIAQAAPPASSLQNAREQLAVADAESESLKVAAAPPARGPALRALNFVAASGNAASASRLGLRYAVLKKSPDGLIEVNPQNELDRNDEVVIRFESSEAGFLSVSQLDVPNGLRAIANQRLTPSVPYILPNTGSLRANGAGTNEYLVRFSRQPQNVPKRAEPAGQAGGVPVLSTIADPGTQATFSITLKYK